MPAWVTPLAQVANFLVLVWLLRRFLYGPIVRVMDERQQRVTSALRDAESREARAEETRAQLDTERAQLEASREHVLATAHDEAHADARRMHEEARAEADAARARWHESLRREQADVLSAVRRRFAGEVGRIASAALHDLADDDLQRRAVATFGRKLAEIPEADANALADSARRENAITVRSAIEIDAETREHLAQALTERLGKLPELSWVTDSALGFGLRIETSGHEMSWSAADYVGGVTEELQSMIEQRVEAPQ